MKKKIFSLSIIVICLAILATGTFAFFTAENTAHNVVTTGGVRIAIVEKRLTEDGSLEDFPEEGIVGMMPGESASKIVTVTNTGASAAWVRVRIEESILTPDGTELPLTTRTGDRILNYEIDPELWLYQDGWYYYALPVEAGEATPVLFDQVHFAISMTNEYLVGTAHVRIFAHAVQTANNGATVLEAQGWPEDSGT